MLSCSTCFHLFPLSPVTLPIITSRLCSCFVSFTERWHHLHHRQASRGHLDWETQQQGGLFQVHLHQSTPRWEPTNQDEALPEQEPARQVQAQNPGRSPGHHRTDGETFSSVWFCRFTVIFIECQFCLMRKIPASESATCPDLLEVEKVGQTPPNIKLNQERFGVYHDFACSSITRNIILTSLLFISGAQFLAVHAWFPESGGLCGTKGVSLERAEHHRPRAALQDPERHRPAQRL